MQRILIHAKRLTRTLDELRARAPAHNPNDIQIRGEDGMTPSPILMSQAPVDLAAAAIGQVGVVAAEKAPMVRQVQAATRRGTGKGGMAGKDRLTTSGRVRERSRPNGQRIRWKDSCRSL